jgi:hypothetical protein
MMHAMRIGGEAPGGGSILNHGNVGHGVDRITTTSDPQRLFAAYRRMPKHIAPTGFLPPHDAG